MKAIYLDNENENDNENDNDNDNKKHYIMAQEFEITIEEGEYEIAEDGSITVTIDPSDYDLIDADDAEDAIDIDEFLSGLDDDVLTKELRLRQIKYIEECEMDIMRDKIESSSTQARVIICDLLRLSHLATTEEIAATIDKLICR